MAAATAPPLPPAERSEVVAEAVRILARVLSTAVAAAASTPHRAGDLPERVTTFERVVFACCSALTRLLDGDEADSASAAVAIAAPSGGALPVLLTCLRKYPTSTPIQLAACSLLATLYRTHPASAATTEPAAGSHALESAVTLTRSIVSAASAGASSSSQAGLLAGGCWDSLRSAIAAQMEVLRISYIGCGAEALKAIASAPDATINATHLLRLAVEQPRAGQGCTDDIGSAAQMVFALFSCDHAPTVNRSLREFFQEGGPRMLVRALETLEAQSSSSSNSSRSLEPGLSKARQIVIAVLAQALSSPPLHGNKSAVKKLACADGAFAALVAVMLSPASFGDERGSSSAAEAPPPPLRHESMPRALPHAFSDMEESGGRKTGYYAWAVVGSLIVKLGEEAVAVLSPATAHALLRAVARLPRGGLGSDFILVAIVSILLAFPEDEEAASPGRAAFLAEHGVAELACEARILSLSHYSQSARAASAAAVLALDFGRKRRCHFHFPHPFLRICKPVMRQSVTFLSSSAPASAPSVPGPLLKKRARIEGA